MGSVHRGIPRKQALYLKDVYNLRWFVETGTFMGGTTLWAARYFDTVYTIDSSLDYINTVRNIAGGSYDNIGFFWQKSEDCLGEVLNKVRGLALIWLDAHWSPDLSYGKPELICPVLKEIAWIENDRRDHIILVDDARLFGVSEGWPQKDEVMKALSYRKRTVHLTEDVFISLPSAR